MDVVLDALSLSEGGWFDLVEPLNALLGALDGLIGDDSELAERFLQCGDQDRLSQALASGRRWREQRDAANKWMVDHAFSCDVAHLRGPITAGTTSIFTRWGSAYRNASRELAGLLKGSLPSSAEERVELVDQLLEVASLRLEWGEDETFCQNAFGESWRGERTDWARAEAVQEWAKRVSKANADIQAEPAALVATATAPERDTWKREIPASHEHARTSLDRVRTRLDIGPDRFAEGWDQSKLSTIATALTQMAEAIERYQEWAALVDAWNKADKAGVSVLAQRMAEGVCNIDDAIMELKFARAEAIWQRALDANPALRDLNSVDRHAMVSEFAALEKQHLRNNVTNIVANHLSQLPRGALGEMKVLRGEMGKKRGIKRCVAYSQKPRMQFSGSSRSS